MRRSIVAALVLAASSATAAPVTMAANRLVLAAPVAFAPGSDALVPGSDAPLADIATFLAAKPALTMIRIEVHGDAQPLTERRALAVARWLTAHGVACARLLPVGFGTTKPVAADDAAANRRTEFHVAALLGHLVGGMPADGGGKVAGDACR